MQVSLNINQGEKTPALKKPQGLKRILRGIGLVLLLAASAYAIHQMFFMVRLTAGITSEKPTPAYFGTLDIINASGKSGLSGQVADLLKDKLDKNVEIALTGAEWFDYRPLEKSLVISRTENLKLAQYVAAAIGLDESEVVYQPPVDNGMSPSVTVVLGEDIQQVLNPQSPTKES